MSMRRLERRVDDPLRVGGEALKFMIARAGNPHGLYAFVRSPPPIKGSSIKPVSYNFLYRLAIVMTVSALQSPAPPSIPAPGASRKIIAAKAGSADGRLLITPSASLPRPTALLTVVFAQPIELRHSQRASGMIL